MGEVVGSTVHARLGDEFTSPLGFRWLWVPHLKVYVCGRKGCHAREAEPHSDACCREAAEKCGASAGA